MKPKLYVAGPWARRDEVRAARDQFAAAGFTCTGRWIDSHHQGNLLDDEDVMAQEAMNDIEDVLNADILVIVNLEKSEGKAAETGIALMAQKGIILIGEKTNVFHFLNFPKVQTIEEAIKVAGDYPWMPGQKPFHLVEKSSKTALYRADTIGA